MPDCRETCAYHEDKDRLIKDINDEINNSLGPKMSKHEGYWKFFFWGAGITLSVMLALTISINNSAKEISKSVNNLTNFASNQEIKNEFITARQDGQKAKISDLDNRVRSLELNKRGG